VVIPRSSTGNYGGFGLGGAHSLTIVNYPAQDGGITPLSRPIEHGRVFPACDGKRRGAAK
jgi:hypothetical protein